MVECEKSLEMLSDYRDGLLGDDERTLVSKHLSKCPPCDGIYKDLDSIILTAIVLRLEEGVQFPDEEAIWQRLSIGTRTIH